MPLMLTTYFLHALDKATLSYTSLFGLLTDTHLRDRQFSYLGSIVFLAQLLFQLPVAWALVKFPIGKFTSAMVLGWGLTLTAMAAAGSFRSLLALRFALGAFEAAVGPAFVAVTQMWWRRREQTFRVGAWYCMNGLSWVFGSLITYVLASIDSTLKPYQVRSPYHTPQKTTHLTRADYLSILRHPHRAFCSHHVLPHARLPKRSYIPFSLRQNNRH